MREPHAIVIGASIAGLLAGLVLAERYDVTILERDYLPDGEGNRKGIPQGRHIHVLLAKGCALLEDFFPGFGENLLAHGATRIDASADARWYQHGMWKTREPCGVNMYLQSRPLLEYVVRKYVQGHSRVRLVDTCQATGLLTDSTGTHVTGVSYSPRDKRQGPVALRADLVVDASGRGSQTPSWLIRLGCPPVEELHVTIDLGYASRLYHRPPTFPEWRLLFVSMTPPAGKQGGVICALEDNQWLVTLAGRAHQYPPADETGFCAFARNLEVPELADFLQKAEPVGPIATFKQPSDRRRYYERLSGFPQGLLIVGDALCSFSPLYAQGITVAALEAKALQTWLRQGRANQTFQLQKALANILTFPWLLATSEDLRFPETQGKRYPGLRLLQWYILRLHQFTEHDPHVTASLFEVVHLLKHPMRLFHPSIFFPILFLRRESKETWSISMLSFSRCLRHRKNRRLRP